MSAKDARQLAPDLHTTPDFIDSVPVGTFAAYAKGTTPSAVMCTVQLGAMESLDRMSDDEFAQIRTEMREKYAVHFDEVNQIISDQLPDLPEDADDTGGSLKSEPDEIAPTKYKPPKTEPDD